MSTNPCLAIPEVYYGETFEAQLTSPICLLEKGHYPDTQHEFLPYINALDGLVN